MRRISFALTTQAVIDRRKTVTRRIGWRFAKSGDRLLAVDKLRTKDAKRLAVIEITSVRREPLAAITRADVKRECFGRRISDFVLDFLAANHMVALEASEVDVTRIAFRYVDCDCCGAAGTRVRDDDAVLCDNCDVLEMAWWPLVRWTGAAT